MKLLVSIIKRILDLTGSYLERYEQNVNHRLIQTILGTQGDDSFSYGVGDSQQKGIDDVTRSFLERPSSTRAINLMYRKFYKLLIIGNPQTTILHIPNRNNGMVE